jgi:hypothetical protein
MRLRFTGLLRRRVPGSNSLGFAFGRFITRLLGALALVVAAGPVQAQRQLYAPPAPEDSLKRFLQTYLRTLSLVDDNATRYSYAFVDLNGDGRPGFIVYVTGGRWCGSGGCPTLVLAQKDSSYRVVSDISITWPPIRVLANKSNGWRSISVWVRGGGIRPGYQAELRFDGKTYPTNPSIPPAKRFAGRATGEVVVASSQEGVPLYP